MEIMVHYDEVMEKFIMAHYRKVAERVTRIVAIAGRLWRQLVGESLL